MDRRSATPAKRCRESKQPKTPLPLVYVISAQNPDLSIYSNEGCNYYDSDDSTLGEQTEEEEEEDEDEEDDFDQCSTSDEYDTEMEMELDAIEEEMELLRSVDRDDVTSLADTVSSELSMDMDWLSTEDEEAYEHYMEFERAKTENLKQSREDDALRSLKKLGEKDCDEQDAVNKRYLTMGSSAGKPCTMVSSCGSAALIDMRGNIMPAKEMLRNYFKGIEKSLASRAKENAPAVKVDDVKSRNQQQHRRVLSEKNGR